jgi:hypothetical protein
MSGAEILLLGGTVLSAVGAIQQGNAQARQFKEQAAVNEYNARVSERDAQQAVITASAKQEQYRQQARRELGRQRAAQAESGLAAAGSVLGVLDQSAVDAELDALALAQEGDLQARTLKQQAGLDRYEASSNRSNAKAAKRAGYISAGAKLLGGAAEGYQARKLSTARAGDG